jgi:hypothetical protein
MKPRSSSALPPLAEFGLDDAIATEIRRREAGRRRWFTLVMTWGFVTIWACWSVALHLFWLGTGSLGRIALAALLGFLAALGAALPLSIVTALVTAVFWPRHPRAADLDRYEKAVGNVRPCDVCVLAMGDHSEKPRVSFCPRCDAWVCEECRGRYDLRAIAALKRRVLEARR